MMKENVILLKEINDLRKEVLKIQMNKMRNNELKRAQAMSKMQDGITAETQKELSIQNTLFEKL